MLRFVWAVILVAAGTMLAAQPSVSLLTDHGRYDAITINGVVVPVQDVQLMLSNGLVILDTVTRRFSIALDFGSEAKFAAALHRLPLINPRALRDLYRAVKVALPNAAAHELTVPSGFGPAHFGTPGNYRALSISLGGVSRVPYTSQADGALGLGLGFGNAFDGLGAAVTMSFNDLSHLDNGSRISWGMAVSHYLTDGISIAVGGENLVVRYTDGVASFYIAGSWAFDRQSGAMPFDGVMTVGMGNGRFADNTPRDIAEGKSQYGSGIFSSLAWQATPTLNVIADWNGRNLTAGLGYTHSRSGITFKFGVGDLTQASGNGPIVIGSMGMTLARF